MRFLRRSLVGLFLFSLTAALLVSAGYMFYSAIQERMSREGFSRPARERSFAVNTTVVESQEIVPVLSAFGEIQARQTLQLRVPTGGRIVELSAAFEEGGAVSAGDVLLRVDPTNATSNLRVAQADFSEAEAELREAQAALILAEDDLEQAQEQLSLRTQALERQNNLLSRGVGTDSAVETAALSRATAQQSVLSKRQSLANARARVDQANTGVLRAQISQDNAERALDDTVLVADFDGILTDVSANLGAIVNANEQIGSLIDPSALEVAFRVSTEAYSRFAAGQEGLPSLPVRVSLDVEGFDVTASGEVVRESAAVGEGQTGRQLFAALANTAGLRVGDFVTVALDEPALSEVAILPAAAVDANGAVLVVNGESRLEEKVTRVLRRQGDSVIVNAAELDGLEVVSERSPLLGTGIRVQVTGGQETAAGAAGGNRAQPGNGGAAGSDAQVTLDEDRRAALVAFVEANTRMPQEARGRILEQLKGEKVPAELVTRLEQRMGQ